MRLLLGVSGGIAAYKSCELLRLAQKAGWEVRVILSANAARFVTPLTFEALSGHPVMTDTFEGGRDGSIDHIAWAKWASAACLAPATAHSLARLACGLADDALSTVWMALPPEVPSVLAPAMNTQMWRQPVLQRNLRWIRELDRHVLVDPVEKELACGDYGVGGMAEPQQILARIQQAAAQSIHTGLDQA